MTFLKRSQLVTIAALVAVIGIVAGRGASGHETIEPQNVSGLDRRVSLLEQRFYSLESSMNRLQQFVTSQRSTGSTGSSDTRDREITLLAQELQRLQARLVEVECGLVKLDERTATARRNGDTRPTDPCRQISGTPLRLSSRPER